MTIVPEYFNWPRKTNKQKISHPSDCMWSINMVTLETTHIDLHTRKIHTQRININTPSAAYIGRILVRGVSLVINFVQQRATSGK